MESKGAYSTTDTLSQGSIVGKDDKNEVVIKRKIGLLGAIALVVGTIIGSGIFISPKGVTQAAGSEGLSLVIWGIGGVISLFGALGLAELGAILPKSAGDYVYLRAAYAKWVGFLWAWTVGILIKPSGQAVVALTCAEYILVPVYNDGCGEPPEIIVKLLAITIILTLTGTNSFSVSLSSGIQTVCMIGKVAALLIIIGGGIYMMSIGEFDNLATGFEGSNKQPGQIIMGFYSAMFAYDGWSSINYVTEEVINPKRNIPLTFAIAIPSVMVLYLMTNVSYFTVMSTDELLASPAVAITWAETVMPQVPWLFPLCVAMSTFGMVNGSIFTSGRLFLVMAREREMPQILSFVHCNRSTPVPAAVFNCVFVILYVLLGQVVSLISFLSFITWMFIGFIQISVIVLRFKMKDAPRSFKVPIIFPIIVALFAIALVIVPVVDAPQIEFLYAFLISLSGLVFYIPIVMFDNRAGCMRYITQFFQLLMDVCPVSSSDLDKKEISEKEE